MQWSATACKFCIWKKVIITVSPETATFDINTSGEGYDDVVLTVADNANAATTISAVKIGETTLTPTTHYTKSGLAVTILKTYLVGLTEGDYVASIVTNFGTVQAVITVEDTTEG